MPQGGIIRGNSNRSNNTRVGKFVGILLNVPDQAICRAKIAESVLRCDFHTM